MVLVVLLVASVVLVIVLDKLVVVDVIISVIGAGVILAETVTD